MLPLFKVTSPTVTIAWVTSGLESEEVVPWMIHRNDGHHNPAVIAIQRSSQSSGHHNPAVITIQWSSSSGHRNPAVITIQWSSQSSGHHNPVSTRQEAPPRPIRVAVHAQHSQQHELAHDASSRQHCKTPVSTQSSK